MKTLSMQEIVDRIQDDIDNERYSYYLSKSSDTPNIPGIYLEDTRGKRPVCVLDAFLPVPYKMVLDITGKNDDHKYAQDVSCGDWKKCLNDLPLGAELKLPYCDVYYYKQVNTTTGEFLWVEFDEVECNPKVLTVS